MGHMLPHVRQLIGYMLPHVDHLMGHMLLALLLITLREPRSEPHVQFIQQCSITFYCMQHFCQFCLIFVITVLVFI
jgi:hypothetical protein